jgi:serine/threonine-protein kinase PRP4
VKLSDFGSSMFEEEAFITHNLIPRFYRPPEIFFGCKYDCKVDIWSLACLLFELYTNKVLFPGINNNQTVKSILELRGKPSYRFLKQGQFTNMYFRENGLGNFMIIENDSLGQSRINEISYSHDPNNTILIDLLKEKYNSEMQDNKFNSESNNNICSEKELYLFKEFLEKCLVLDPSKRISSLEALTHPFVL